MLLGNIDTQKMKQLDSTIEIYGFKLNQQESDPESMVSYIEDNRFYDPAYMDFDLDKFNYGDWENVFFMDMKPCMVKYTGEVDYFLDPNDYSKKLNGEPSDISNVNYQGNAMVQVPKIYWKIVSVNDVALVYISNYRLDDDFNCWSHINNQGEEIDFCYMPIYNGSLVNETLRSLSGQSPISFKTAQSEINYALKNNKSNDILWYTSTFSDWMLINLLLILIGKSVDSKSVFGQGNNKSYVDSNNTGILNTGSMNNKGMFYGSTDNKIGVKVFGMEHWWGNLWKRIAGYVYSNGKQKIKMTYGTEDGSTIDGYNLDGSGYIEIPDSKCRGTSGGYINKAICNRYGLLPVEGSGSATTYFCSMLWFNHSQLSYAAVGGRTTNGIAVGSFCLVLDSASSTSGYSMGTSISLKPLH